MARQNTLDAAKGLLSPIAAVDSEAGRIIGHVDGHMFTNTGKQIVELKATGAVTVNIPTPATAQGAAIADTSVVLTVTGQRRLVGPFPPELFNQRSGADRGKVYLDFTGTPGNCDVKVHQIP